MRISEEELAQLQNRIRQKTLEAPTKRQKFGAVKKIVNGAVMDSTKEANRYIDLLAWQASGQIEELRHQVPIEIHVNGVYICDYVADFTYVRNHKQVVEDVKSKFTRKNPLYRLKKKLVEAIYKLTIEEV